MNNKVQSWSSDYRDARLARVRRWLCVFMVAACAPAATLNAQVVSTLISSNLFEPHSAATDGVNAYVTDASNNRIVKFDLTRSNLTTLAGLSGPTNIGYADGTGSSALFNQPLGIVYARGGLVVVDSGNHLIRFVTTSGTVTTLAGNYVVNGLGGFVNGVGTNAQFAFPTAITADAAGNLYVADTGNKAIRKIDNSGSNVVSTVSTNFNSPEAVSLDVTGNLWVADTGNNSICVISNVASANTVTTIANTAHLSGSKDGVNAASSTFNFPSGLLWTTNMHSLLISDTHNNTIRNLYFTNGVWSVQTLAGRPGVAGQTDGSLLDATFDAPVGLALDLHDGNNYYYVVDRSSASNGTLRALQPSVLPQLIPGPPSVTITSPSNNFVAITPPSIPITLTYSDTNLNGSVTNIELLTNGVVFSSNSVATSYTLNTPNVGTLNLTAIAVDNYGISATSAPITIQIIAPLAPLVGIVRPTNASFFTKPSSIAIVVTNLDPNTPFDPAAGIATVTIQANGTNIPTIAQPSNTFIWNSPAVGQYSLTAIAIESPFGLTATSPPVNISVLGVQQPIVAITNPAAGQTFFLPTNITVNVNAVDPNTNGINAIGQVSGVSLLNQGVPLPSSQYTYLGETQPSVFTFILNNLTVSNYVLSAVATDSVFQVSGTSAPVNITVTLPPPPPPGFSPSFGYFPFCQTIQITETAPGQPITGIYYTTDGTTPSTNSIPVSNLVSNNGVYTGSLQWCNPSNDLSHLQLISFNGVVSSVVTNGGGAPTNIIGFVRSITNGPGATVVMPIVVDLKSNGVLSSLQFRAEVIPSGGNPPPISSVTLLPLSTNDFVPLIGPGASGTAVTFETVAYPTTNNGQGLLISAAGANSGFSVNGFGVVGLLAVQIPTNAANGQTYQLNVLFPSGTSDAQQTQIGLQSFSAQTLTVDTVQYFEGDSSPGSGYNAGEFGDGILNAADVNNALYASVGIRVPFPFSDVYNAMDTYPETATELGDGFITYLDWQHILFRSEGLETNNWVRFWTNGARSHRAITWTPGSAPVFVGVTPDPFTPKGGDNHGPVAKDVVNPPGWVWMRQASVGAGSVGNVGPGGRVSVPVYARIQPGYSLTGLQFRATLVADNGAPAPGAINFNAGGGIPTPASQLQGASPSDIVCAWDVGAFRFPLVGSNYLGTISFVVPAGAQQGHSYSIHFSGVDGAPDLNTFYQLESFPGAAYVLSPAQPSQMTSDEWRTAFFGSYTNTLAGDNVDADGDGASNWQEYIAGTNPTNALSRLQFSGIELSANKTGPATLSWVTAPGKTYLLESTPALGAANWSVINTNVGDGNLFQFSPGANGGARFYRISVQPQ
jgi:sugar lactone lactonase YvrE